MNYFLLCIGIGSLVYGGIILVKGASSLSRMLGVSSLIIGLTVVSFGTTTPELFVSLIAALNNEGEIAFGNIIGSNIVNILLILGISASFSGLRIRYSTIWREIPFSFLAAGLLLLFSVDFFGEQSTAGILSQKEGIILIAFFCVFLYYIYTAVKQRSKTAEDTLPAEKKYPFWTTAIMLCGGIVLLYVGAKFVVHSSVDIARDLGISEFLISATIIAL